MTVTYADIRSLEEKLYPWMEFMQEIEGSEIGDQYRALQAAIDCSSSASDYDTAMMILNRVHELLKEGDKTWLRELIEYADEDFGYRRRDLSDEAKARSEDQRPSVRVKTLPKL